MQGKDALQPSSRAQHRFKLLKSVWIITVIWLLAIGSLLGTHHFLKHKLRHDKAKITKIEAKLKSLTEEQKTRWLLPGLWPRNL